ncbi:MAG: tRNA (N(6)-L-threonylcarbamoyladenosine(37)-C(2))-methylthiotransferase [Candidatus Bathyarchaeia archaeon]
MEGHHGMRLLYFENYGCAANKADLEIMLALLAEDGYSQCDDPALADLILVNSCGVKGQTEERIRSRLARLRPLGKPIIVSGCLPRINLAAIVGVLPDFAAVLDPLSVDEISEIAARVESGERNIVRFSNRPPIKPTLPKSRLNERIEILQISEGCTLNCSYCSTKLARGDLFSYPLEELLQRVRRAVEDGAMEIWITAQDAGAYGIDIGLSLVDLLDGIISIPGKFKVRVGMMNPMYARAMLDDLLRIYEDPKVYKFIHIPVQSGSEKVLKSMKRPYSPLDFAEVAMTFRERHPDITVSTDVIVGFPSEEEEDFEETMELMAETRPDIVNISKFTPRPGTEAYRMGRIDSRILGYRSRLLTKICRDISYSNNLKYLGRELWVTFSEECGKRSVGRLNNYRKVIVDRPDLVGSSNLVRIEEVSPRGFRGRLVLGSEPLEERGCNDICSALKCPIPRSSSLSFSHQLS